MPMLLALTAVAALGFHVSPPMTTVRMAPTIQQRPSSLSCRQADPEEITEKYGLEAGLFSALRKKDSEGDAEGSKSATATAGDLLKRYGGAYLLTSTSFALVSFTICYLAVSNGVDVGSLLEKIPGIEVSSTSETAGTVGLAYAIHKAASPIRFPPTVALTPVVARKLFGKTEAELNEE